MAISDVTREAAHELLGHYLKTRWPALWLGYSRLPEEVEAVTGFQYGYVMGDAKSITVIDAPCPLPNDYHLSEGVTVPFMPFAASGHQRSTPPAWNHPFKLLVGVQDDVARVTFTAKAGAEFARAAKNSVNRVKHPVIVFELTRFKSAPKSDNYDIRLGMKPKELEELLEPNSFTPTGKANARTFGLWGERAGALMKGHEGRIEFYGTGIPCVIRSLDEAVVSILMAPTPQEVLAAQTRHEDPTSDEQLPDEQTKLPGFEEEEKKDGQAEEGKDAEARHVDEGSVGP